MTSLKPEIWGPHYWFVLHTIALTYPLYPNDVVKRKYYDFIQTLPLLIPEPNSSKNVSLYIDQFSVTPYLDSKNSFMTYINRMHNHFNVALEKDDIYQDLDDSIQQYFKQYNKELYRLEQKNKKYKKLIIYVGVCFIITTLFIILYLYKS
jgi:hypothetical protein